jgi:hypothetical protein
LSGSGTLSEFGEAFAAEGRFQQIGLEGFNGPVEGDQAQAEGR